MFSDPQKVVDQLKLSHGMHIADVGSGAGFYSIVFSEAVGSTGKVYAIDVQKSLLNKLNNEAITKNLHNVETIWGDIEKPHGTKIRDNMVDIVATVNIFFQVEEKKILAQEVARIVKPGGRVLVVDWSDSFGGLGPQLDHVFKPTMAKGLLEEVGLKVTEEIKAGAHHYGIVFTKPDIIKQATDNQ